jgi:hypothetical protein
MHFSAKKFFLIGFFVVLLLGIPLSVYFLQQQQTIQQEAAKSTNFSFNPTSSPGSPITKKIGDDVVLEAMVDPGTNAVTSVTIEIEYDPDKLEAGPDAFEVNDAIFPTILAGPTYEPGKITATLSVGTNTTNIIQTKVKAATITFKALANTDTDTPTQVTFNIANSNATSQGTGDQFSENVLLPGAQPAVIVIKDEDEEPPPSEPEPTIEVTEEPVIDETTDVGTNNTAPFCVALTADQTSGTMPFAVNFTANGTDEDGTISKATFNFGDGQVSDVTSGGGIGSNSANIQLAHTYSTAGTFQATAIIVDNDGGISDATNCSQTISVLGDAAAPTVAASGSTEVLFGIGALSILFIIGGGLLFLIL